MPLNARVLPLSFAVVFSIALGLTCCLLFVARDRTSCSSSLSSSAVSGARDLRLTLRQIFLARPSSVFLVSCLRSHPRGILTTGRELGSSKAASVSSHVWLKDARVTRFRGEGTMVTRRHVRMPRSIECYTSTNISRERMLGEGVERRVVRVNPLVGGGSHNKHEQQSTLGPFGPFPRLETFGLHRHQHQRRSPSDVETHVAPVLASPHTSQYTLIWSRSHRAVPYSRPRIDPSHHYRSSAFDGRISQRQTRAWE